MLYERMMTNCVFMEKRRVPDGYGGWTNVWETGAPFKAAILKDSTLDARIAERDGITELYTVSVPKETPLEFMDVFKRVEDGQTFRVKSNMKDNASPTFSAINFGQVTAERWELE